MLAIAGAAVVAPPLGEERFPRRRAPARREIVRTLGKVTSAELGPGLHLVPPYPFGDAEAVATGLLRSVEVGFRYRAAGPATAPLTSRVFVPAQSSRIPEESQLLTGDENVIEVAAVVHYRVADPALFRSASTARRRCSATWPGPSSSRRWGGRRSTRSTPPSGARWNGRSSRASGVRRR